MNRRVRIWIPASPNIEHPLQQQLDTLANVFGLPVEKYEVEAVANARKEVLNQDDSGSSQS